MITLPTVQAWMLIIGLMIGASYTTTVADEGTKQHATGEDGAKTDGDNQNHDEKNVDDGHGAGPEDLIHHAETFYWVAMQERGSMTAIKHGLKYLDKAEKKLPEPQLCSDKQLALRREIAALRDDLENQYELHKDTHYGVFPLARFVGPTLFSDPRASGSFELIDDPREVATREAVDELIEHVIEAQTVISQFDVVFVSDPASRELENEALYKFNHSARFFVHNRRELAKVLDMNETGVDDIWPSGQMDPSSVTLKKMVDSWKASGLFRSSHLLLVRLRKIDEYDDDYFYIAEGRIFDANAISGTEASTVLNQYGFCIDRRKMLVPILALHGLLLFASLLMYPVLVRVTSHSGRFPSLQNTLAFGCLGFLWGRGLIWALAPMMAGIEPAAETLAIWSFWWPATAGAVFILGPAIILGFADRRFHWFGSAFETFNRGGAMYTSIGLGSAAFLGQCALIYKEAEGWWLIPPLLLTTIVASFTVGRAFDKTDRIPLTAGLTAVVLTFGLGAAWCNASPIILWLTLIPLGAVLSVYVGRNSEPRIHKTSHRAVKVGTPANTPKNVQELAEWAYDPPFLESASFLKISEALIPWREGKPVKIGIQGPAGAGKSAALNAIACKARENFPGLIVLKGVCDQPTKGSNVKPYQPFVEAIANHFAVNLLAPHGDQMVQIDDALGGIFDRVVPFADILFPPHEPRQTGSRQELFTAIAAMLRRLASQHPVMLILDDVHWMDSGSMELLEFLLGEFPQSKNVPIAFLLASRNELKIAAGFDQAVFIKIEPLNTDELRKILVGGLGSDSNLIKDVLDAAGQHRDNLHWLFQIVAHIAQKDLLVRGENGFSWKDPQTKISEHVPGDIRQSLEELIANHKEFRPVLECAACVGQEFSVDLISNGVGIPRLELIHLLDRIEEQTGIVMDLHEKDDHFAFRSTFVLEVLRKTRDVVSEDPRQAVMPKRIREYHHRLAVALERTLEQSNSAVYAVANHYFAAGSRHAGKALEFSLKAAKAACLQFQHELARKYLAMAQHCAAITSDGNVDFDRELLLISCHQAHVEGQGRVGTAQQALKYLRKNPEADFEVYRAATQASYDAGIDTREPEHFGNCVRLAQEMLQRFSSPPEQAEARHFYGIGLPANQRDDRLKQLRMASDLAEKTCQANREDLEILRLKSRIAGSLAEQLSYGSPSERKEARDLFEQSIAIKQREDIRDLQGLAFAYGGLGRLSFFNDPPDFKAARKHFEEDLRYSEKIGSLTGQTKMHSLLGACLLSEGRTKNHFEAAIAHYEAANTAAVERVDKLFALAGLLECHASLNHSDTVERFGLELHELLQKAVAELAENQRRSDPQVVVPVMCRENLKASLKACLQYEQSHWFKWLNDLLAKN